MERTIAVLISLTITASLTFATLVPRVASKRPKLRPPAPCHPNPDANVDMTTVRERGDIRHLPDALKDRLVQLAGRPHSQLPTQAYAEAHFDEPPMKPKPSQLFQYYLLDTTGFEPNPFTSRIAGVNDTAIFTDIDALFVINNESGWYEGWMIHDLTVAPVNNTPRSDGHAQFGAILQADANALMAMGTGHNVPGNIF